MFVSAAAPNMIRNRSDAGGLFPKALTTAALTLRFAGQCAKGMSRMDVIKRRGDCTRRGIVRATIILALSLCVPAVFGQHTVRNLTGTVTDQHHEPLRGAVVEVHNEDTDSVVSYITGRSGRYSFKRLDGDTDYRVWATHRGHRSSEKKLSLFDMNRAKVIDLVIKSE